MTIKHIHSVRNTDLAASKVMEKWQHIYFLGIGGIGMSALARYFLNLNRKVSGYDKTVTELTNKLKESGININFEDSIEVLENLDLDPSNTLIVYTPAIPSENEQFQYFTSNHYTILKRSKVLGEITKNTICFAVAGTHGKTTTSCILAHLLNECEVNITAFLGGICKNFDSNFISKGTDITVVEADEYDRSFLTLSPDYACITSMDADHLDIYGDKDNLTQSFKDFTRCLKPTGKLFIKSGLSLTGITYGIEDDSDYSALNVTIDNGIYLFHLKTPNNTYKDFKFNLPGRHNLSNAIIALAMTVEFGCPPDQLAKALASFNGVERRFNYHIRRDDLVYIDDYAHHPTEVNAVFNAVNEMYPKKTKLVVFQPHLFSRTKDFADEFALELSRFDYILLLDIYPAREKPLPGITSQWLLEKIGNPNKILVTKESMVDAIRQYKADVVLTLGAGDIGQEVELIKRTL